MTRLVFDLALPWWVIGALALLALLAAGYALARGLRGWAWRGAAGLVAALALAGPALERAERQGLSDIVILVEDRSASQTLPGRTAQIDGATESLARAVEALPGTELRRVTVGNDDEGTLLGSAITEALAAEPEARVAGVIAVTDGRLHDAGSLPADAPAPVHVLLTGEPQDWDRRLVVEEAPAYALIGEPATVRVRVEDQGAVPPEMEGRPAALRITRDSGEEQVVALPPGVPLDLPVTVEHGGANVLALALDPPEAGAPQLTDRNDAAALTITGVRDRLRVLLVSGEPHAGERTWRNLLKSDAAVELIHFTILRPPDKMDGVPVDEMALIAFPTRELFMERIGDFDLIIFDRYRERGILPPEYFDNIRRYVEDGGAILIAGGPEMATVEGLTLTALGDVIPARPTGRIVSEPFTPALTEAGRRHPITAGLPGAGVETPEWGRWLRRVELEPEPGAQVVMEAGDGAPLLVLSREEEGRVAVLGSDQVWLWARGFEGGGPQLELLRRIAHWSMSEPDLEEEALRATVGPGLALTVIRQTLAGEVGPLGITGPDGGRVELEMRPAGPGHFTASWTAPGPGLYRLTQGERTRLIAVGPAAPREFEETVADGAALAPLAEATRGAVLHLSEGVPDLRSVRPGRPAAGQSVTGPWIAITPRGAETVSGRNLEPLLPDWGWLALIAGLALGGWLVEGRRRLSGAASR
ncbi:hypothetical protein GI374_12840 [Paracoccus sp. S-4012]|uniref:hypothetical protein n=1 Tax=Paracoccus sp. S-4012 TaxID=2665648 RepID=UPI0012AFD4BF|nr:hypothetical protein [Paracoccus sp. S-4012]MRX51315.1 hypothetical protein [Paracoccus sp. S-4012]